MRDILLYFSIIHDGDWQKIYDSIEKKEIADLQKIEAFKKDINCAYVTIIDPHYPKALKNCFYPPYVLFYRGDIQLLDSSKKVGIVGSRNHSEYGTIMAEQLTKELVQSNHVVVSGAAKGIDIIAQKTCLQQGGKTIAVIGNGLNHYYPAENKNYIKAIEEQGLVVSEYPPNALPRRSNFPNRNRIIAALSEAIIVVEAQQKSGTLITVKHALEMGKEIYCVPYRATEKSMCNELIKQGAQMIESIDDFKLL